MRRVALCLALLVGLLPLTSPARADLRIEGETLVIVTKLPFKVSAPGGAKLYFWRLPPGWKGSHSLASPSVEVTEAPEGSALVECDTVTADFVVATHRLKVNVGKVVPVPPGPDPGPKPPIPPSPDDPLSKAIHAAWAKEMAPDKAACLAILAGIWRRGAARAAENKYGDMGAWLQANRVDRVAVLGEEALLEVRTAVAAHLRTVLPVNPMALMSAETRALCARESNRIAVILEGLR